MRTTTRVPARATLCAAQGTLLLASCSLSSFVDLDVRTCGAGSSALECNEQVCGELNMSSDIDVTTACEVYQYAEGGGCTLGTRDWDGDSFTPTGCGGDDGDCDDRDPAINAAAEETCDTRDENCDGVIDDGVFASNVGSEGIDGARAERAELVRYAADGSPYALLFTQTDTGAVQAVSRVDLRAAATAPISPAFFSDNRLNVPREDELEPGCAAASGDGAESCSFGDMALSSADGNVLAAAIDTSGCAQGGRLRVGYFDGGTFVQRGPEARSNVFRGVDLTNGLSCGGMGDTAKGGTGPSVALSERRIGQARAGLAAWRVDAADETTPNGCGTGAAKDLRVLGLWLEEDKAEAERLWVNAADDGEPQTLGTTTQGFAPALLALPGDGASTHFLAVYREATSGLLEARRVAVPKSPAFVGDAPDVARDTPSIELGAAFDVPGTTGADAVSLVLGPARADGVCGGAGREIGVTYRTGCGSAKAQQLFTSLGVRDDGTLCALKPIEPLGEVDSRRYVAPASGSYVASGFVREGFERGGKQAAADATGGFILAWTEGTSTSPRAVVGRLLDLDGTVLDTLTIADEADSPHVYTSAAGALQLAYRDAPRGQLRTLPLSCRR